MPGPCVGARYYEVVISPCGDRWRWSRGAPALVIAIAFLLFTRIGHAQSTSTPFNKQLQWFAYSGDHAVKGKWGLHFDGGWRQMNDANWNQWLVRPGVNYQVSPNVQISGAYSYFMTHPGGLRLGLASFPEHRLQEQITLTQKVKKIPLRHRFRVDQRFLGSGARDDADRSWHLQHRARYMLRSDIPLKRGEGDRTVLSLGLYDEVFLYHGPRGGIGFEQNRIYAGLTLRPSPTLAFECGAFSQRFHHAGGGLENNVVLLIGISSTVPLSQLLGRH